MSSAIRHKACLLLLLFSGWSFASVSEPVFDEVDFKTAVNHKDADLTVSVLKADSGYYFKAEDLAVLGLPIPSSEALVYHNHLFYPAQSITGYRLLTMEPPLNWAHFVSTERHETSAPATDLLLTIIANGRTLTDPQHVRYEQGELLLPEPTLRALGIDPSKVSANGDVPLHVVAGENFIVDYSRLSLEVMLLTDVLETSRVNVAQYRSSSQALAVQAASLGTIPVQRGLSATIDYEVSVGRNSELGSWQNGFYAASLGSDDTTCRLQFLDPANSSTWRRTTTSCVYDWTSRRISMVGGDAIGGGDQLTQPIHYGGIKIGTDFELQPSLLLIPSQSLSGSADLPSTLEVWVDHALTLRTDIPAGPFEVSDIPLRTGAGEVRALITPLYGEPQTLSYAFYMDTSLLAKGLTDWSVDMGKLRENLALPGDTYGESFGAWRYRRGFSNRFTAGLGLQATERFQLASANSAFTLGDYAAMETSMAASQTRDGVSGSAFAVRLTHQSRYFSASYMFRRNGSGYQELAYLTLPKVPQATRQLNIGAPLSDGVSVSYSDGYQAYSDGTALGFRSATVSVRLGWLGSLRLSAFVPKSEQSSNIYTAQLTLPLGKNHSGNTSVQTDGISQYRSVGVQKNLPAGPGHGYRFHTGHNGSTTTSVADVNLQSAIGRVGIHGNKHGETENVSTRMAGSVLISRTGIVLSPQSPGSYAVVDVGAPGVPLYHGGQLKAYTDKRGRALIAGLRPFEDNTISIRAVDVPIDVQPNALATHIQPGRRDVIAVNFGFQRERYVAGKVVTSDGQYVPAGARVRVDEDAETVVGERGEFFVTVSKSDFGLIVVLPEHGKCIVNISLDQAVTSVVTDVGTLTCKESNK